MSEDMKHCHFKKDFPSRTWIPVYTSKDRPSVLRSHRTMRSVKCPGRFLACLVMSERNLDN